MDPRRVFSVVVWMTLISIIIMMTGAFLWPDPLTEVQRQTLEVAKSLALIGSGAILNEMTRSRS